MTTPKSTTDSPEISPLLLERRFTDGVRHPYEMVEWELRIAEIPSKDDPDKPSSARSISPTTPVTHGASTLSAS